MNKISLALVLSALALSACDDDTSLIGMDIMPEGDQVSAASKSYHIRTATVEAGAVYASTSTCYLGSVIDPEMRIRTTSSFLAQFHLPDNFKLPAKELMVKDNAGELVADSCDLRLYFDQYYGDSLATMKLNVQELSKERVLEEGKKYYTDLNPADFLNPQPEWKKSVAYAVKDLSRPSNETDGSTYYRQVVVKLPKEYANRLLRSYYEHPEYFKNSYQFIHNICPGFYFESAGGVGSMITSKMMAMNLYFSYHTKTEAGKDTIVDGMQRFGATEEVIQCTKLGNDYPGSLSLDDLDKVHSSYVKTPAGLLTEMTLPVAEIVAGEHYTDSISQAKITLRKYNTVAGVKNPFAVPKYLLMVRKEKMKDFFEKKELPNGKSSYLSAAFDPIVNTYFFANLSQLVTELKVERDQGAGVTRDDDEAARNRKYAAWEAQHPDWNKVMLVPVTAFYTQTTNYYGQPIQVLQEVRHDLGLGSARLEGGNSGDLKIDVVYSRLNR